MVFDEDVVLDQRLRIDDAMASDGSSSVEKGFVHDDSPLPKQSLTLSRGPVRRGALKIAFPGWIVRMHDTFPLENFPGSRQ